MWVNKQCWKCFSYFVSLHTYKSHTFILHPGGRSWVLPLPCGWGVCVQMGTRADWQGVHLAGFLREEWVRVCAWGVGGEDPILGDVHLSKNNWLTLSLNERSSSVEAGKVGEVAQVLWPSGGPRWRKGKGEEHCLEFDQVLLEEANLGQGPQEEWVLGLPDTASAYRGQLLPRDSRDRTRGPLSVDLVQRWCGGPLGLA